VRGPMQLGEAVQSCWIDCHLGAVAIARASSSGLNSGASTAMSSARRVAAVDASIVAGLSRVGARSTLVQQGT
jgi:hypothetical protein